MPPRPKYSKREIVSMALQLISIEGVEALTAKQLGKEMGTSTSPIFTYFSSMQELLEAVRCEAMYLFDNYASHAFSDMLAFKQIGMKTVMFALHEPKLYQLLFMQEQEGTVSFDDLYGRLGKMAEVSVEALEKEYALSRENAKIVFETVWIYTFGIGALCATKACCFSEKELSHMLSIEFQGVLTWIKSGKNTLS